MEQHSSESTTTTTHKEEEQPAEESTKHIAGEEDDQFYDDDYGMIIMEANLEKDIKCSIISDWNKGDEQVIIGRGQVIGFRENQEDFENILIKNDTILCGVFDGHCGDECARFISSHCLNEIFNAIYDDGNINNNNMNISTDTTTNATAAAVNHKINEQGMEQTFAKLQSLYILHRLEQQQLNSTGNIGSSITGGGGGGGGSGIEMISLECGTTANVVLLSAHDPSIIYSINCGDSRAIYFDGSQVHALSRDHKPTDPNENCRITKLGANVDESSGRIDGLLSYSRSFGDLDYQPIVSYSPELKIMHRKPVSLLPGMEKKIDEFIVIATDGLFEGFKTNEECVQFIHEFLQSHHFNQQNASSVVSELVAKLLDTCVNDLESMDNVTIQIIIFMSN